MSSLPVPYFTPEEYLKIDRASEIRNEYISGEIVPMVGGSYNHALISANSGWTLKNHLEGRPCQVLDSSARVLLRRGTLYAYPDATVVCGKPEFADKESDIVTNPKLVVEVLSPSTRNYDLGDKTRAYLQIPSLTDLLLVEQEKVWIEYWSRQAGNKWDRNVFTGMSDVLRSDSLECDIPVAGFYAGVDLAPSVE